MVKGRCSMKKEEKLKIKEVAQAYLKNQQPDWLKIVKSLIIKVAEWVINNVKDASELNEVEILDILQPELTSPAFVTIMVACKNTKDISDIMFSTLDDIIENLPIKFQTDITGYMEVPHSRNDSMGIYSGDDDYDYDDDYDFKFTKRTNITNEDEYSEADKDPLVTSYAIPTLYYQKEDLKNLITEFLHEDNIVKLLTKPSIIISKKPDTLFKLDIIDVNLYKTLIQHPQLIHTLNWRTFEKLLADILESFGYQVELQKGTKDGGVDLFAVKKLEPFGPIRFLLQAKRQMNKVEVDPVRLLKFSHDEYKVNRACLATTSTFTHGAWELAKQYKWWLELRDFDGLQEWIKEAANSKVSF